MKDKTIHKKCGLFLFFVFEIKKKYYIIKLGDNMKLVADVDTITSNLSPLTTSIEDYTTAVSKYDSESIKCTLDEINGALNSFKNSISEDLNELNKSSHEYNTLVEECCSEYKSNESNTKEISAEQIIDIIKNCTEITSKYEGNAKVKLVGLPSTDLYLTAYYDPNLRYLEGGLPVPLYYQGDYHYELASGKPISSVGCGWTSCAMIASYLTRTTITPDDMASWSQSYYNYGDGMDHSLPPAMAEHYGLGTVTVTTSTDDMYQALKDGKVVMCSQDPGLFTREGHLIVLRGLNDDGNILVNDPNRNNAEGERNYNTRAFTKGEIGEAAKKYWIFEGDGENVKV